MSLRALPLMVIPLVIYNIVVVFAGGGPATGPLGATLFRLPMLSGATWTFAWGDVILLITFLVLFAELVKATYTSTISLVDHGLSMLVFVACLIARPEACEEKTLSFLSETGSAMACALKAPPTLATWSGEHPGYRISSWHCQESAHHAERA